MATTVNQLIEMLSKLPGDMEVAVTECESQLASMAIHNEIPDIKLTCLEAQSNRDTGDSFEEAEDYIEYGFDEWKDPVDKKTLVLMSFKY